MLVAERPTARGGRQLELAEVAAEGDVRLIGETGVTPDRDTPAVLGIDDRLASGGGQRLRQIEPGDLGAEARQEGANLQIHGVAGHFRILHAREGLA